MNATLKNRLAIKRLEIELRRMEEDNFGYSPRDSFYDALLAKRNALYHEIKTNDKEWFEQFDLCQQGDIKKLMVF